MSKIRMTKYRLLEKMLCQYLSRITSQYECDVVQLDNNIVYRSADPLDHLEMIMAQTRRATAEKISSDIFTILEIVGNK